MLSTGLNMKLTGFRSPPTPPSRRRDYYYYFYSWTGHTLTNPVSGPNNGVHPTAFIAAQIMDVVVLNLSGLATNNYTGFVS